MTNEEKAEAIINKIKNDPAAFCSGRRNNDTVNLLICCTIMGYDYDDVALEIFGGDEHDWNYMCYQEHRDRIEPYLDTWCPVGNREKGLDYLCETNYVKEVM